MGLLYLYIDGSFLTWSKITFYKKIISKLIWVWAKTRPNYNLLLLYSTYMLRRPTELVCVGESSDHPHVSSQPPLLSFPVLLAPNLLDKKHRNFTFERRRRNTYRSFCCRWQVARGRTIWPRSVHWGQSGMRRLQHSRTPPQACRGRPRTSSGAWAKLDTARPLTALLPPCRPRRRRTSQRNSKLCSLGRREKRLHQPTSMSRAGLWAGRASSNKLREGPFRPLP